MSGSVPTGSTGSPGAPGGPGRQDFTTMFREQLAAQQAIAARRPVAQRARMLPRALPWSSPVSRLWAGTKVLCLLTLSTLLLSVPRWPVIVAVALLFLLAVRVARVPRSVVPRGPWWLWWGIFWGGASSAWAGELEAYVRSVVLGLVLLLGSFVLLWTTRPDHLAPAFATLLAPLRLLRMPVDEWSRTMTLSLRGLPVLSGELRAIEDASRLRGGWQRRLRGPATARSKYLAGVAEVVDVATAALAASQRRAVATGRAMTLRGGVPPVRRERPRLGLGDLVAVLLTAAVVAVSLYLRR